MRWLGKPSPKPDCATKMRSGLRCSARYGFAGPRIAMLDEGDARDRAAGRVDLGAIEVGADLRSSARRGGAGPPGAAVRRAGKRRRRRPARWARVRAPARRRARRSVRGRRGGGTMLASATPPTASAPRTKKRQTESDVECPWTFSAKRDRRRREGTDSQGTGS